MESNNLTVVASFTPGLVIGLLSGYMLRQYWYLLFKNGPHDYSQKKDDSIQNPDDSEWEDIESEEESKGVISKRN